MDAVAAMSTPRCRKVSPAASAASDSRAKSRSFSSGRCAQTRDRFMTNPSLERSAAYIARTASVSGASLRNDPACSAFVIAPPPAPHGSAGSADAEAQDPGDPPVAGLVRVDDLVLVAAPGQPGQ